jgi:RsiW-degrading membrane proteinase PrsW (M82 family)
MESKIDPEPRWPLMETSVRGRRDRVWFFSSLGGLGLSCIALAFVFDMVYDRTRSDLGFIAIASFMYGVGMFILIGVTGVYLRIYSLIWPPLIFVVSLLLFVALITTKGYMLDTDTLPHSDSLSSIMFRSYISAAFLEESLKLITYIIPIILFKDCRTIYHLIYFAVASGVSFGTLENLTLSYQGVGVALGRFLWCTGTHASDCLTGSLVLAYMKSRDRPILSDRWYWYPLILLIPVSLHGTYDLCIFLGKTDRSLIWLPYMSVMVGVLSLFVACSMAWPFRRSTRFGEMHVDGVCVESQGHTSH